LLSIDETRRTVRKFAVVLSAGAVLAAVVATSAVAANNLKISGSYSYVDNTLCADPVQVDGTYNEMLHSFYDNAGNETRVSFTGNVTVTYTNLTNGSTFSPNSSGPGTIDLATGQTVLRGGNGSYFDSSGHLIATDGRIVLDSHGNVVSLVGQQTDVCSTLGSTPAP
jgi:hypothetical protein